MTNIINTFFKEIYMKGFIRHLDSYRNNTINLTTMEYATLLYDVNINYTQHKIGPLIQPYTEWQKNHEVTICPNVPKKIFKEIDVTIQSIGDLIKMIDDNPVDSDYEYNIDLKTLHMIRPELESINNMIGLHSLKQSIVDQLLYFIQHLHTGVNGDFKHTVLVGPPGTGKTDIARLMGQMYSKIGVLNTSIFKKATRSDLVAGYLGQTAIKTQKLIQECLGGVLFIDEAYSLGDVNQTDSFSRECIDTLCEALSSHKDNLMVVIAGYEEELKQGFFNMNPGLESRFLWRFKMEPYSAKELRQIFIKKVKDNEWDFENVDDITDGWFEKRKDKFKQFGRDMENLYTYTKISHGRRIYGKPANQKRRISLEDLEKGYQVFLKHKDTKKLILPDMYL